MDINEKYNGYTLALLFADSTHAFVESLNEGHAPTFVLIEEGTGDNLLDEDIDEGYIDYLNWTMLGVSIENGEPNYLELDGGMVLTEKYVVDMTVSEVCDSVLEQIRNLDYLGISIDALARVRQFDHIDDMRFCVCFADDMPILEGTL